MDQLSEEVRQWHSPLIGAYLIWKFTLGYYNNHPKGDAPSALLHFISIPLLTNNNLLKGINNRRDNFQSYIRSFESSKDSDYLLNIHNMILEKREYTLKSIDVAISTGLIKWDSVSAKIYPLEKIKKIKRGHNLRQNLDKDGKKAEILGKWFTEHSISDITTYLKVVL